MKSIFAALPLIVADVGDFTTYGTAGEALGDLNNFLKLIGTSIGVILLLVGIVKLIMSAMDENAKAKQDASLLFGISIMFISISNVLTSLGVENINKNTKIEDIAGRIIMLLGNVMSYAGAILTIVAIVTLILSISQENPEQQTSGVKLLTTAIGLFATRGLASVISGRLLYQTDTTTVTDYMAIAVEWFANVVTYAGGGFAIVGVFKLIMGIRTEDSKERDTAIKIIMVGIGLLAFNAILVLFGITF